jgi:hypothetical protein
LGDWIATQLPTLFDNFPAKMTAAFTAVTKWFDEAPAKLGIAIGTFTADVQFWFENLPASFEEWKGKFIKSLETGKTGMHTWAKNMMESFSNSIKTKGSIDWGKFAKVLADKIQTFIYMALALINPANMIPGFIKYLGKGFKPGQDAYTKRLEELRRDKEKNPDKKPLTPPKAPPPTPAKPGEKTPAPAKAPAAPALGNITPPAPSAKPREVPQEIKTTAASTSTLNQKATEQITHATTVAKNTTIANVTLGNIRVGLIAISNKLTGIQNALLGDLTNIQAGAPSAKPAAIPQEIKITAASTSALNQKATEQITHATTVAKNTTTANVTLGNIKGGLIGISNKLTGIQNALLRDLTNIQAGVTSISVLLRSGRLKVKAEGTATGSLPPAPVPIKVPSAPAPPKITPPTPAKPGEKTPAPAPPKITPPSPSAKPAAIPQEIKITAASTSALNLKATEQITQATTVSKNTTIANVTLGNIRVGLIQISNKLTGIQTALLGDLNNIQAGVTSISNLLHSGSLKVKAEGMGPGGGPMGTATGSLGQAYNLAGQMGLGLTSHFRAGDPGYHGLGRAMDFSNGVGTREELAFANAMISKYGSTIKELIHTPLGFGIKNGVKVPLSYWGERVNAMHYNHVHVAFAEGPENGKAFGGPNGLAAARSYESAMVPGSVKIDSFTRNASEGFGQTTYGDINVTVHAGNTSDHRQLAILVAREIGNAIGDVQASGLFP